MKIRIYHIIALLLIMLGSCKKDSDQNPDNDEPDFLFKANFVQDWLSPHAGEAMIFISDNDGIILSEMTWTGNDSFEMQAIVAPIEYPDSINITTVYFDPYENRFFLTTNLSIPVGSEWTFKGFKKPENVTLNEVNFIFENVPDHKGYVVSDLWNSKANEGSMAQPFSFNLSESPTSVFLKMNTVSYGLRYTWFNNVTEGTRNEDLSVSILKESTVHSIDLNGISSGLEASLHGYSNSGQHTKGSYRLDVVNDNVNTFQTALFAYPGNEFTDYRTLLRFYDDFSAASYWTQVTYGPIPGDFIKMNADFDIVNSSINNFEIAALGEFTQTKSVWSDEKNNNWTVYGKRSITKYQLPVLSAYLSGKFNIERSLFKIQEVELIHFPALETHEDVLEVLFNSSDYLYDVVDVVRYRTKIPSDRHEN